MTKLMFYKNDELANTLSHMLNLDAADCSVEYSENAKTDVLYVHSSEKEMELNQLLGGLGTYTDETIIGYDVIEVGDMGEGFAFFIA